MGNCSPNGAPVHSVSKHPGLKEGDVVPNVIIKARIRIAQNETAESFIWKDISTESLFKGKRVVVFSIPGGNIITNYQSMLL